MKTTEQIINDSLIARVRELEEENQKLKYTKLRLQVNDYLLRQFVFTTRNSILSAFAEFVEQSYEECAENYGYENIDGEVLALITDLADGIDIENNPNFNHVRSLIEKLK